VCADLDLLNADAITAIAEHVARMQVRQIAGGLRQVMRRLGPACPRLAVLAGQGAFVARAAAEELGLTVHDFSLEVGRGAARATPAAAVALLLAEWPMSERNGRADEEEAP
jgi:uncharacterized hydantoinase/oxoprolinase family protein